MKKNIEIQILRGVAVILTMIEHTSILSPFFLNLTRPYLAFWVGVDIFFVISGYVITCSLYPMLDALKVRSNWWVHLRAFWCKRIFRILPAAWLWISITLVIAALYNQSLVFMRFSTTLHDAAAAILQYANFHWADCWVHRGFGVFCSGPAVLAYFWSLSLEEQFYLVLPLVILIVGGRWRIPALALLLLYLSSLTRGPLGLGWHNRIDGLVWGVLIALYFQNKAWPCVNLKILKLLLRCSAVFMLGSIVVWGGWGHDWSFSRGGIYARLWLALVAFLAALLVFLAVIRQKLIYLPRGLHKVFSVIGERSYALYLAHCPIFAVIKCLELQLGIQESFVVITGIIGLGFGLSFLCAELTYRYVEMPSKNYGVRLAARISQGAKHLQIPSLVRD